MRFTPDSRTYHWPHLKDLGRPRAAVDQHVGLLQRAVEERSMLQRHWNHRHWLVSRSGTARSSVTLAPTSSFEEVGYGSRDPFSIKSMPTVMFYASPKVMRVHLAYTKSQDAVRDID